MKATNGDGNGSAALRQDLDSANEAGSAGSTGVARPEVDLDVLPDLLGYRLRRAQVAVFQDFMQTVGAMNVTPGQFGVLAVIGANDGLSQSAVAEALGTERSTMVALVDRLERDNLVVRRRHATDRRSYALSLTPKGRSTLGRLKTMVAEHEARIATGLTPSEQAQLLALMAKLTPKK